MTKRDLVVPALLFLLAFGLRFHDLSRPSTRWMDENNNLDAAVHYWETGQFEPDTWEHPPLRNLSAYAFLEAFGDNPYGWRMRNVLLGSAAAALAWLFGFHVGGRRTAALAGLLLATDPLHVVLSRFTFEEIYGSSLFLAAVVLFAMHRGRTLWLVASALLLGSALATKWYYAPAWALMLALLLREEGAWREPRTALFLGSTWILLPLTVYLATYWQWFGRGYSLADFPEFILNAYRHLQAMDAHYVSVVDQRLVFQSHTSALEWFVRPIWIGEGAWLGPNRGVFLLYVNDIPVWALTLPALAWTAYLSWRERRLEWALPALFFSAMYALDLRVDRPVFIYSAAPLLPFAFTGIALALSRAAQRLGERLGDGVGTRVYWATVGAVAAWNLYVFPLVTAKPVPGTPYRWLLDGTELILHRLGNVP